MVGFTDLVEEGLELLGRIHLHQLFLLGIT
jgi:hypothetical protein